MAIGTMDSGEFKEPANLHQIILDILESNMYTDITSIIVRTCIADAICSNYYQYTESEDYDDSEYPQTPEDCK